MKQIVRAIQLFTDKLKSYIVAGLIMVLVPSFAMSQNLIPNKENGAEKIVPNVSPPVISGKPPYGTIFMLNKPIACNDTPVLMNYIKEISGMISLTMGTNLNSMGGILSLIQVYANPVSENFAVVEHFAIQKSCIILQGHNFKIILPDRYYEGPTQDD